MIYSASTVAIIIFTTAVVGVLALSFFLGSRARSAAGYFAAHGQVHWFVNGIAFAGDYLSAASFLGICGLIAFFGYDGCHSCSPSSPARPRCRTFSSAITP